MMRLEYVWGRSFAGFVSREVHKLIGNGFMLSQGLIQYYKKNEALATEAFKIYRLSEGVTCKRCKGRSHYWLKHKQQFQCKNCRFRTTLKSGTIMEGCKLPLSYFFITLYLLIESKGNLTVHELQEVTEHKYFEPLWSFLPRMKLYLEQGDTNHIFLNLISVGNSLHLNEHVES